MKDVIFEKLNKFSWAQATSNGNGKSSGSGTAGLTIIAVGLISFMIGVVHYAAVKDADPQIMIYSTGIVSLGAGLLGYRKSKDIVKLENDNDTP